MVRAVFFDIDGTLYSHKTNSIPPSALAALKALRRKGILVFLATGRHRSVLEQLPALQDLEFDGAVTLNGGYSYDHHGLIHGEPIDREDIEGLLAYLEGHPIPCGFIEAQEQYMNFHNDRVREVHASVHTPPLPLGDLRRGLENPVYQILLYLYDGEDGPPMPHCKFTRWYTGGLDVIPSRSGKAMGIAKMLEHYGIDRSETMAFGDGENDLDMFEAVHTAVALGNAHPSAKAAADYVTADVDDDGIARALVHLGILEGGNL